MTVMDIIIYACNTYNGLTKLPEFSEFIWSPLNKRKYLHIIVMFLIGRPPEM